MRRYSFKMKLKPGCANEYRSRHSVVWEELEALLADAGICEYLIVLDVETNTLFASQKLSDDFNPQSLTDSPVMKKWWEYMADIMETEDNHSPRIIELEEIFYMP